MQTSLNISFNPPTFGDLSSDFTLVMSYDNLHNIVSKEQLHQKAPGQTGGTFTDIPATTYRLDYAYEPTNKPHAPREITDKPYTTSTGNDIKTKTYNYDANGNLTAITQKTGESETIEKLRTNLWDEENRLRAVDITPDAEGVRPIAIYTYDAGGERILKHSNTSVSIYLNGKKVADTIQTNAMLYPSGMLVGKLGNNGSEEEQTLAYTKHYYAGTQRVSSKIGTTENLGDYLQDWYTSGTGGPVDVIGSSFGVLENAEEGVIQVYEELEIEAPEYDSSPVFIPVQSFVHGGNEVEQYFFHPDHLGSTSYITNLLGEVSQHMEYFAFGETFVEEHRSSNNSPYKFNGKELDEETGWYYYGARYYDPRISIWLSVDPLANVDYLMNDEAYINGEHNGGVVNSFNHNSYAYTYQNPIRYIDPNGKQTDSHKLQGIEDGAGSLYYRTYSLLMIYTTSSKKSAEDIFTRVNTNFADFTKGVSYFEKIKGASTGLLKVNDELAIVGGPNYTVWKKSDFSTLSNYNKYAKDNPQLVDSKGNAHKGMIQSGITVIGTCFDPESKQYSMTFQTWKGHVEAGTITFSATEIVSGAVLFKIESRTRSANTFWGVMYENFGGINQQTKHWKTFLSNISDWSGADVSSIVIDDPKVEEYNDK